MAVPFLSPRLFTSSSLMLDWPPKAEWAFPMKWQSISRTLAANGLRCPECRLRNFRSACEFRHIDNGPDQPYVRRAAAAADHFFECGYSALGTLS